MEKKTCLFLVVVYKKIVLSFMGENKWHVTIQNAKILTVHVEIIARVMKTTNAVKVRVKKRQRNAVVGALSNNKVFLYA